MHHVRVRDIAVGKDHLVHTRVRTTRLQGRFVDDGNTLRIERAGKRRRIEEIALLLRSVLEARHRLMVEVNASAECLERVVSVLPAMRRPTVSPLYGNGSYAVKAAVPREALPSVIPALKAAGGTDVVVSTLSQIVP